MTPPAIFHGKRADLKLTLALIFAVVAAVALAIAASRPPAATGVRSEELSPLPASARADGPPLSDAAGLNGEVVEVLPVSNYTYLRLRTSSGEVWAAVPRASIAVGSHVAIADATRMDDFKSSTLKRTFEVIYFGTLSAPVSANSPGKFSPLDIPELSDDVALPPGHPDLGTAAPLGSVAESDPLPVGHPDLANAASPHAGLADTANGPPQSARPARPVAPALGRDAHVISELTAQRQQLAGRRVRVRAEVTKVTPDVNGRAFFHLQDSSAGGDEKDLVATAVVPPQLGAVAIFEGTLRTDVDVGIGYKYPVLLEDVTIVPE